MKTCSLTYRPSPTPIAGCGADRAFRRTRSPLSIRRAASGVGVELDVRLSSDGVPFVFHDATLERMCGSSAAFDSLPAGELERMLPAERLSDPHAGDVLDIMGDLPVLIELKVEPARATMQSRTLLRMRWTGVAGNWP